MPPAAISSPRSTGCARSCGQTARCSRSASAPAGAWRSSRRLAPRPMPRCRSTAWASPTTLQSSERCECPVHLHYGMKDPHIPLAEVDEVKQAAQGRPSIEIYCLSRGRPFLLQSDPPGLPRRVRENCGRTARSPDRARIRCGDDVRLIRKSHCESEATKQSILSTPWLDCFASLAMRTSSALKQIALPFVSAAGRRRASAATAQALVAV